MPINHRNRAAEHVRAAADNLAALLAHDPAELDNLTDTELMLLDLGGKKGAIATATRKLRERDRAERETARKSKQTRRYPSRTRLSLEPGAEGMD